MPGCCLSAQAAPVILPPAKCTAICTEKKFACCSTGALASSAEAGEKNCKGNKCDNPKPKCWGKYSKYPCPCASPPSPQHSINPLALSLRQPVQQQQALRLALIPDSFPRQQQSHQ